MAKKRVGIRNGALFNQTSTLWNNLLAYYTGDGTPDDALGNHNGTLTNGATYGTGIISNGFSFDGVNDTVDMGNNFDFDGSTPFSISCWVNPNNVTSIQTPLAKAKNTIDYEGYWFLIYGQKMLFILSSGINANDLLWVENSITLSTSTWYHCVMTYDGSKSASGLKVYVNNSLNTQIVGKDSLTGSISNTRNFKLGARDNGQFYNGIVDEVGIWNRELSASEVTELYNSGVGKQYTPPAVSTPSIITDGLVLNLDAGNTLSYPGTGTDWFDLTSNNNDGVLLNGASYITDGGGSILFDGVNDYVLGKYNMGIVGDAEFTIAYWAYWNGTSFSTNYPSGFGGSITGTSGRNLSTTWKDGRIALDYWNNRFRAINPLSVQTWYYVTFTKTPGLNDANNTKLYANAIQLEGITENSNAAPNIIDSTFVVGRLDTNRLFNGKINNIKVYNRALTDSEVLQNYNATKDRFGL